MVESARIILASASPRRRELLEQIGITARVQAVDIDESRNPDEPVIAYVERLAMEKAQRGYDTLKNIEALPVLGSDTMVEIGGTVLGKPEDREHAKGILEMLSGQVHQVHTSVAIVTQDMNIIDTSSTHVHFKTLEAEEIDSYIDTGEADDKAGAYAIQGIAAQFVKNINGSYSGVMGLPLYETVKLLKQCGIRPLELAVHK
ncbi:MAG: septum formation inhibitor Maf [Gammaproteobacteria bacterium]|nr:septum formation inhibitor Maf [Gammaproteobacteria bacterium]NNJ50582.1 septum formation inhibitor Maf [Gammaproteobacteria bacterium]